MQEEVETIAECGSRRKEGEKRGEWKINMIEVQSMQL
jgi:hypothetical protein